jgi:MFS family permease
MTGFVDLLRRNRNYRFLWGGQVVSEVGDHFNNIAVLSLALTHTGSGFSVAAVMLSRAVPALAAGPLAGVLLDRFDRRKVMITSDLARAVIALGFMFCEDSRYNWLLYVLSGLLMFASPFFTSGRGAILPTIATKEELHTANSLTQGTAWATVALGSLAGGWSAARFGYDGAFFFNALSFLFSAWSVWQLKSPTGSFTAPRDEAERRNSRAWHDYVEGLRYLWRTPLLRAIAMVSIGWATGGGAAQILFTLFGEQVFRRGPAGTGDLWGSAGLGLVVGGVIGHLLGRRLTFAEYRRAVPVAYLIHGGAYVVFSQMTNFTLAAVFLGVSRAAVAVSSVMNFSHLLRHTADEFRGRVLATIETASWSMMLFSMTAAGVASMHYSPRVIGAVAGVLSSLTALWWLALYLSGRLPEPEVDEKQVDLEVHDRVA